MHKLVRNSLSKVKANAEYDLHSLGWYGFQQLCSTILREILGQTVASFLSNRDGGRDGGFKGTWKRNRNESTSGTYVFQCKFTNTVGRNLNLSDVSDEINKAADLVKRGFCDNYFLITNAGITGSVDQDLTEAFKNVGIKTFTSFGYTWICDTIRDNKRLRT